MLERNENQMSPKLGFKNKDLGEKIQSPFRQDEEHDQASFLDSGCCPHRPNSI